MAFESSGLLRRGWLSGPMRRRHVRRRLRQAILLFACFACCSLLGQRRWNAFFQLSSAPLPPPAPAQGQEGADSKDEALCDPLGDSIWAYVNATALTPQERHVRKLLLEELRAAAIEVVDPEYPEEVSAELFGSSANGCEQKSSDLDVAIVVPEADLKLALGEHKSLLELHQIFLRLLLRKCESSGGWEKVLFLLNARVPLLTITKSELEFDLTCNDLPKYNTRLLREYTFCHPYVRPLVMAVKRVAKAAGMSGVGNGGWISSYSWTLMAIYYMQCRGWLPSLQALAKDKPPKMVRNADRVHDTRFATAEEALARWEPAGDIPSFGEVFRDFFTFYGREYGWEEEVVSVRLGRENSRVEEPYEFECKFGMPKKKGGRIHIEDPIELNRNLNFAMSADQHVYLRHEFRNAEMALRDATSLDTLEPSSSAGVTDLLGMGHGKPTTRGKKARPGKKRPPRAAKKGKAPPFPPLPPMPPTVEAPEALM